MKISTPDDVKQLGTILGVWAHPDDETFTCGGLLAAAINNGQRVVCVTATKGEAGVQDESRWPAERLGEIRAHELQQAMTILGITEHSWLDYHDGDCDKTDKEKAVAQIREIINKVRPDTILTFGPDGLTGHPDHRAVSDWASKAAGQADYPIDIYQVVVSQKTYDDYLKQVDDGINIFFNTDNPPLRDEDECDICLILPQVYMNKKYEALKVMPSQTDALFKKFDSTLICHAFGTETFDKVS